MEGNVHTGIRQLTLAFCRPGGLLLGVMEGPGNARLSILTAACGHEYDSQNSGDQ
jgi:hypothetical protein